jgi:general L-amino acid transport system substrate-binding protein
MRRISVKVIISATAALLLFMLFATSSWGGETLPRVRSKGVVRCGVSEGLPGFSMKDKNGRWTGFDADFCRAVAAATLGDPEKIVFVALSASARFPALLNRDIDLLMRNTTWTLGREVLLGTAFAGVLYYDGQGFMVPSKSKVRKVSDLNGATICVERRTTHVEGLADYFGQQGLRYTPLVIETLPDVKTAFFSGRCQAYTSDRSQLAAVLMDVPEGPRRFNILPDVISKEPLGPVVKRGDEEWFTLVKWVLFSLIEAEELGITKENVRAAKTASMGPAVKRFLDADGKFGKALGASPEWTVRIIGSVGNYGEIFDRNLGSESALNLERGLNRLWNKGGLMYAPPFE